MLELVSRAKRGEVDAMTMIASYYENGNGGFLKNISAARYWYLKAIKHPEITPSSAKDASQQLENMEQLFSEQKKSNEYMPKKASYDKQIVIDFLDNDMSFTKAPLRLCQKWNLNHSELSQLLPGDDLLQTSKPLDSSYDDKKIRLYIIAHGLPGSDYIIGDDKSIHYDQLAKALANYIGNKKNITINLVSCQAGEGFEENEADSFGAKLHRALCKEIGRDIPVVARTSVVSVRYAPDDINQRMKTSKMTVEFSELEKHKKNGTYDNASLLAMLAKTDVDHMVHHQSKSKVLFKIENGKQVIFDAYTGASLQNAKWKSKVISELKIAMDDTLNDSKKRFLADWIADFKDMSPNQIYKIMKQEINNAKSPIKHKDSAFSKFFNITSNTESSILGLVEIATPLFEKSHSQFVQAQLLRRKR